MTRANPRGLAAQTMASGGWKASHTFLPTQCSVNVNHISSFEDSLNPWPRLQWLDCCIFTAQLDTGFLSKPAQFQKMIKLVWCVLELQRRIQKLIAHQRARKSRPLPNLPLNRAISRAVHEPILCALALLQRSLRSWLLSMEAVALACSIIVFINPPCLSTSPAAMVTVQLHEKPESHSWNTTAWTVLWTPNLHQLLNIEGLQRLCTSKPKTLSRCWSRPCPRAAQWPGSWCQCQLHWELEESGCS